MDVAFDFNPSKFVKEIYEALRIVSLKLSRCTYIHMYICIIFLHLSTHVKSYFEIVFYQFPKKHFTSFDFLFLVVALGSHEKILQ